MENSEILDALAHSVAKIVDDEVAKKTEKSVNLDTLVGELKSSTLDKEVAKELYEAILAGYGNEVVKNNDITPCSIIEAIDSNDTDLTLESVLDELSNEESTDFEYYLNDKGYAKPDDVDEEWVFDYLDDSTIRDITKRYLDENL